jgi:acyl dehydratase
VPASIAPPGPARYSVAHPFVTTMPITLDKLLARQAKDVPFTWTERDTMLYALAVGMGRDPFDEQELDYCYERRGTLRALPSQAVTLARHNLIYEIGLDVPRMLHGEQLLTLHRPLPPAGELLADHRIVNVFDKGPAKGLLIESESRMRLADGTPLFDIYNLYFARGDGGMGSSGGQQRAAYAMPQRAPDLVRATQTEPRQALLYRLTGDRNVIHGDPVIARQMGFPGPVLHGSCTLAIACREVLAGVCGYDNARLRTFGTRFTSVVYPGDRIETDIWIDGENVSFRCRVPERNVVVLDQGLCRITT